MSDLDKVVNKSNGITDWNNSLETIWKDDIQMEDGKQEQKRDWSIYLKSPAPDWSAKLWRDLR